MVPWTYVQEICDHHECIFFKQTVSRTLCCFMLEIFDTFLCYIWLRVSKIGLGLTTQGIWTHHQYTHTSLLKPDSLRLNSSRCQQPWWPNERNIQLGSLDWCSQNLHSWSASVMLAPRTALFSCNQLYLCSWTNDSRCLWTLAIKMMLDGLYLEHVLAEIVWTRRNCEGFIICIVLEQEYTSSCGPTFDIFYCSIMFNPPAWPAIHSK